MYKAATIFLFLFLLSCTVTKRVHRPGFHIEWKKNYKVQKENSNDEVLEARESTSDISALLDVQSGEDDRTLREVETKINESQSLVGDGEDDRALSEVERRNTKEKSKTNFNLKQHAHSIFIEKTRKYAPLKMPKVKKDAVSDSGGGADEGFLYLGYILLGIGGYLLIGALLSYFGFWLMENLFYSLVFSGNGIIAGILGFILFLLILLFVFIAYAIVHYLLGGAYMGFIVSLVFIGAGLLCLLIWACL